MEKTYIMQTAETIRLQLLATTPANTLLSWGILYLQNRGYTKTADE